MKPGDGNNIKIKKISVIIRTKPCRVYSNNMLIDVCQTRVSEVGERRSVEQEVDGYVKQVSFCGDKWG